MSLLDLRDYWELIVGAAFLVAAARVLPGRMRWYVLTIGLAFLGYEAYLRVRNRKALAEADAEREQLRGKAAELDRVRKALEQEIAQLNAEVGSLRERQREANVEAGRLGSAGEDLARRGEEIERRIEARQKQHEEVQSIMSELGQVLKRPSPPPVPQPAAHGAAADSPMREAGA